MHIPLIHPPNLTHYPKASPIHDMLHPTLPCPSSHLLLLSARIVYRHFLPRTTLLSLVHNLPAQLFSRVLHELNRREVVFVLLQRSDPRDVIERDDLEPEVLVVADLLDLAEEGCKIGSGNVVDVCEEVCWGELVSLLACCANQSWERRRNTYSIHISR
jgi:hypothetical protein